VVTKIAVNLVCPAVQQEDKEIIDKLDTLILAQSTAPLPSPYYNRQLKSFTLKLR